MSDTNPTNAFLPSSNLLHLPPALRRLILAKNASKNILEYYKIRAVCKTLRDDADHTDTLFQIDLIKTHHHRLGSIKLENAYFHTAVFLKAISDFMYSNEREDAFKRLKECAIRGIESAVYCYEIIRRSIFPQFETNSTIHILSRSAIRVLRRHVSEFQRLRWPIQISKVLRGKRDAVDKGRISTCPCAVHRYWIDLLHEGVKGYGMCDPCFWAIEIAVFYRIIPRNLLVWTDVRGRGEAAVIIQHRRVR